MTDFAVARIEGSGALDATFGTAGKVTTDLGGVEEAHDLAVQPDGGIVVVGTATAAGDFAVARYLGDSVSPSGIELLGR